MINGTNTKFFVQLMFEHPSRTVDQVSVGLGREPTMAWNAGDPAPRRTLPARRLKTVWYLTRPVIGSRKFFSEVTDLCDLLQSNREFLPNREFLREFLGSGGKCRISVQLGGKANIGDELQPSVALLLGKLGVTLGVEVFPELDG